MTTADLHEQVRDYTLHLSTMVGSINPMNVWDLPLWSWIGYMSMVDAEREEFEKQRREARRG